MTRRKTQPAWLRAICLVTLVLTPLLGAKDGSGARSTPFTLTSEQSDALARISPASLRGHLSFLASDSLQGRETPSQGLDLAAEYIGAQFRRADLEPVGDDGYFQSSRWTVISPNSEGFRFTLTSAGQRLEIAASSFSLQGISALNLDKVPVVKIPFDEQGLDRHGSIESKAVITELPALPRDLSLVPVMARRREFLNRLAALKPRAIVAIERTDRLDTGYFNSKAVRHPEFGGLLTASISPARISVSGNSVASAFDAMPAGATDAFLSVNLNSPQQSEVVLRNVVGLLRGSDPVLKDSYILLSAHYDHVGMRPQADGDKIWNGANDNGSGTVSVIEIASALAGLRQKPRRSIVFITFFGEERGLLGSRYYGKHPAFPLERTVAAVNLEQVGRTDSTEGDQRGRASLTGFDYSEIGEVFQAAGEQAGITVYKHERNSDTYFGRSDNQALAALGIPAHTLCVAFTYPDYHGPADHWNKIDYENMARTDRMVALALLMLAQNEEAPRWNSSNPRAVRYLKAWEELHPR